MRFVIKKLKIKKVATPEDSVKIEEPATTEQNSANEEPLTLKEEVTE